jgi:hypothetical protein
VEPKTKDQAEQVQWVFRDPQASSYEDANIVVTEASSGALTNASYLLFLNISVCFTLIVHEVYMSCMMM